MRHKSCDDGILFGGRKIQPECVLAGPAAALLVQAAAGSRWSVGKGSITLIILDDYAVSVTALNVGNT